LRIAGVARRALADAGFAVEYIMQALKASAAPPDSLVLTGAAGTEVVTTLARPDLGVLLVLQWILPWAPLQNDSGGQLALGKLARCLQADSVSRDYKFPSMTPRPEHRGRSTAHRFGRRAGWHAKTDRRTNVGDDGRRRANPGRGRSSDSRTGRPQARIRSTVRCLRAPCWR
jgi:hypothetical protein